MSDYEFLKVETEGNILIVTMNRPEVYNAVHIYMHQEMDRVWNEFAANDDLWVVVLTGAGDKAFCAGNDLKATAQGITGEMPKSGFAASQTASTAKSRSSAPSTASRWAAGWKRRSLATC